MRLFTGIALAPNVLERLSALLDELRPTASIKWSPVENLHITSRFIGEWPEGRLLELLSALGNIAVAGPIPLTISRFGFFPRSLVAEVQAAPELDQLKTAIDQALLPLGLTPETRIYHPHVTLARIKGDIRSLREHIAGISDFDFGAFDARDFHLYLSKPTGSGSVYTKLATYDLMREKHTIS